MRNLLFLVVLSSVGGTSRNEAEANSLSILFGRTFGRSSEKNPEELNANNPNDIPQFTRTPSRSPSSAPSEKPTTPPSFQPTNKPSYLPTTEPSYSPSIDPTGAPSLIQSEIPSKEPSHEPTNIPSVTPSVKPSSLPSEPPSQAPSYSPTSPPSISVSPSSAPTKVPTVLPSSYPSYSSSVTPSIKPTSFPSDVPSNHPSPIPSKLPSLVPSQLSSSSPTLKPSLKPTSSPSTVHSASPSISKSPSTKPSSHPAAMPSFYPTGKPSTTPSIIPSSLPSGHPTQTPSKSPSKAPSMKPSLRPTITPTPVPSVRPTSSPSTVHSTSPSISVSPSTKPSLPPTVMSKSNCSSDGEFGDLGADTFAMTVSYSYQVEVNTLVDGDIKNDILPAIEKTINYALLPVLFETCQGSRRLEMERISPRKERRLEAAGLSSRPIDEPVDEECQVEKTIEGNDCIPIDGGLTLFFRGTPSNEKASTLDAIKAGMEKDSFASAHPAIVGVTFIGEGTDQNQEYLDPNLGKSSESIESKTSLPVYSGVMLGVGFFLFIVGFVGAKRYLRKSGDSNSLGDEMLDSSIDSGSVGSGDAGEVIAFRWFTLYRGSY